MIANNLAPAYNNLKRDEKRKYKGADTGVDQESAC